MGWLRSGGGRGLLAVLLAGAACGEEQALPEGWNTTVGSPTTTEADGNDASGTPESTVTTDDSDSSGTTGGTAVPGSTSDVSTSGSDDSTTGSESSEGPELKPDLPPAEEPLPQGFQLPFECGQAWRLDSWAHAPAIDMVREPDQFGTDGATLTAAAAGTVVRSEFHQNAGNLVQLDHGEGWFTTSVHLQSRAVEIGDVVEPGQVIGAVGATGPTSNGHPHLHFEVGFDANGDGSASWGTSDSERVEPWFDGVEYGQSNGLTWRDVVSANCR